MPRLVHREMQARRQLCGVMPVPASLARSNAAANALPMSLMATILIGEDMARDVFDLPALLVAQLVEHFAPFKTDGRSRPGLFFQDIAGNRKIDFPANPALIDSGFC